MEEHELYLPPMAFCHTICPEGVLCCTENKNVEDPDEDVLIGW